MFIGTAVAAQEQPSDKLFKFDIPRQAVDLALTEFAEQADLTLVFPDELVRDKTANALIGEYTLEGGATALLAGTGLVPEFSNEIVMSISTETESTIEGENVKNKTKIGLLAALTAVFTGANAQESDGEQVFLEEIVVTAAYREQNAQDVASGIQVFGGLELERLGASSFEDYILTVPGASFRDQGSGNKRVAIRGISNISANDFGAPTSSNTVGVYLNDIPIQGTNTLPDLALFDLERVEVLKGPQGTLYGDGSMGGAIKMVLNKPDTTSFGGKASTTVSYTKDGGVNFGVNAAINLPIIEDKFAVRFVSSARKDDGFIDNVATGEEDANTSDAFSFRLTALANLSDSVTAEVLILRDESNVDEHTQINMDLGDLEFDGLEDRFTDYEVDLYALTIKADLGFAELTSVTSQYQRDRDQVDRSQFFFTGFERAPYTFVEENESVVQELRLVSSSDSRFDWVVGGIYRDRTRFSDFAQIVDERDVPNLPSGLVDVPNLFNGTEYQGQDINEEFRSLAVYGEASFPISDAWTATLGLRWYDDDNSMQLMQVPDSLFVFAPLSIQDDDSGTLFKASLSYDVSDSAIVYVLASEGYRAAAPNSNFDFGVGDEFASPGQLWNYEVGAKTQWADGRVILNGAYYYSDWSDFQTLITAFSPIFGIDLGYIDNGGDAEVKGLELQLAAAVSDNVTFGATAGFTDSEVVRGESILTEGQPLPNIPETTFSAYGEWRGELSNGREAYVRLDGSYVSEQDTLAFTTNEPTGVPVDSYSLTNFRIGIDGEAWGVALFVDNIGDERGQLGRGLAGNGNNLDSNRLSINRPRTIGIMLRGDF